MRIWLRTIGFSIFAASLSFSTGSSVLAASAPTTEKLDSLGAAESNENVSSGLTAEAHLAERSESGSLLSVTWSIKNEGDSDVRFNWPSGTSYMYSQPVYYSGVTTSSRDGHTRYHPLMDGVSDCVCSGQLSLDFKVLIKPEEQVAYWSMYSVPEDVDAITLEIPGFEPIEDIPIS